jgi:hypothetical protein
MKYPVLEPVPILTKGLPLLMRIWVWLFSSRKWKVSEDWYYETMIDREYATIFIPKGFIFDGASIPRFLWWLLQPMGILLIPGLVHDYAYRYQKIILYNSIKGTYHNLFRHKRDTWDEVFREISVRVNGCEVISYVAWLALYIFGGFAWRKNRKLEAKRVAEDWIKLDEDKDDMSR